MTIRLDAFALLFAMLALAAAMSFSLGYADGASTKRLRSACDLNQQQRSGLRPRWYMEAAT